MKKLGIIFALTILLAGCATAPMSPAPYAQGYAPPPQNLYATPWVGPNTPWVFYKGDWFLNGILYNNFGNTYGWAPYYAYPPTYIVRPNNWYAMKWNTWYQQNPHYWQNFQRQYPYWAGHQSGQRYDQNFYNRYHRGQGEGWNQGFHGVRPPGGTGPGVRPQETATPGVRKPGATGAGVRPPGATGPGARPQETATPGVRPPGGTGPGVRKPGTTTPGKEKPQE